MSKKNTKAQRERAKKRQRQAQISAFQTRQRILDNGEFYHGGTPGLEPGAIITSRAAMEAEGKTLPQHHLQPGYALGLTDRERIYFCTDYQMGRAWAARLQWRDHTTGLTVEHGTLYRVEPIGQIEPDPDFPDHDVSWSAPQARVVSVEETNVSLDPYEATQHIGPYQFWADGSPIYDEDGSYLLAPEQIAAGGAHDILSLLPRWTPLDSVNAFIDGTPPLERPQPEAHPGISHSAKASIDVRLYQRANADRMDPSSAHIPEHPNLRKAKRLLKRAGQPLPTDDTNLKTIVQTRTGTLIAAVLIEPGQTVQFIRAVAVAPKFRRRGYGTALLAEISQTPRLTLGHCATEQALFFAELGYTVLHPEVDPSDVLTMDLDKPEHHHWFYREGPL